MPQTLYCDEAGYTGNNLLDPEQPFFTYATLAIEPDAARELVAKELRDWRIDGAELKGKRLLGSNRGQQAITSIVRMLADRLKISVLHKRYSLAGKFFEHTFEPVLAKKSSLFYNAGFHRFISNILYFEAFAGKKSAAGVLERFQEVIRARDADRVPIIFSTRGISSEYSEVLREIEAFVLCHQGIIAKDIAKYSGEHPIDSWMLDLSVTALFWLLAKWGERYESLVVCCDESKPLHQNREAFEMMIGRTDRAYIAFEDKRQSVLFNLAEPLHFLDSKAHPGIQLADVVATAFTFALRYPQKKTSSIWREMLDPVVSEFSIFPDAELLDLKDEAPFVNRLVLHELVERSLQKADLFEGMPGFMLAARDYRRNVLEK